MCQADGMGTRTRNTHTDDTHTHEAVKQLPKTGTVDTTHGTTNKSDDQYE